MRKYCKITAIYAAVENLYQKICDFREICFIRKTCLPVISLSINHKIMRYQVTLV